MWSYTVGSYAVADTPTPAAPLVPVGRHLPSAGLSSATLRYKLYTRFTSLVTYVTPGQSGAAVSNVMTDPV